MATHCNVVNRVLTLAAYKDLEAAKRDFDAKLAATDASLATLHTQWDTALDANDITFTRFWNFVWTERRELVRYLRWAGRMRNRARQKQNPASLRLRN